MAATKPGPRGRVALVGAGPGDPGLLTRRAWDLLQQADVVVHDALIPEVLLAEIPERARRVDVGKRRGKRKAEQEEIHRVLVENARAGRFVVRLQGGDPLVFGRGGEEMEALRAAEVDCEVVPGVTSGFAAAALAGIPVTHRLSGAVTLVTGHDAAEGGARRPVSWFELARTDHTLVILMGLARLREIAARLVAEGRDSATPVAVVQEASTPRQREVFGTLADIAERVQAAGIEAPATVIVGKVAGLGRGAPGSAQG